MARNTVILDNITPCVERLKIGDTGANLTVQPGTFVTKGWNATASQFVWERTTAAADKNEPVYLLTEDSARNVLSQSNRTVRRTEEVFNAASAAANIASDAETMPGMKVKDLGNVLARLASSVTIAPGALVALSDNAGDQGTLEVTTTAADAIGRYMGEESVTSGANENPLIEVDLA